MADARPPRPCRGPDGEQEPAGFTDDELRRLFSGIENDERLALAVSGGGDSTALMRLAARWAGSRARAPKLLVLTVDHGLRPGSAKEALTVKAWTEALGLEHHTLVWGGPKPATGIQAAAREARYGLMGRFVEARHVQRVLTAHTLEDQAETVLMRLSHGSGIDGLAGMAERSVIAGCAVYRPLLGVSGIRLRACLRAQNQPWIEDPSNAHWRYERARVRRCLDHLGARPEALAEAGRRAARAARALGELAHEKLKTAVVPHDTGYGEVDAQAALAWPDDILIRALGRLIACYGSGCRLELRELEGLAAWLGAGRGAARTLGGCRIARRARTLLIGREPGRIDPRHVAVDAAGMIWDGRFALHVVGPAQGLSLAPLSQAQGVPREAGLPAFVQAALPAVFREEQVIAVPHLGFRSAALPRDLVMTFAFTRQPWS